MKCACPPRLKHRAVVERPGTTKDAAGHVDLSLDANWSEVDKRWFRFVSHGGREGRVFDQVQAETNHVLELMDDSLTRTIPPKWRLKYGTRKFNIVASYESPLWPKRRMYFEVSESR